MRAIVLGLALLALAPAATGLAGVAVDVVNVVVTVPGRSCDAFAYVQLRDVDGDVTLDVLAYTTAPVMTLPPGAPRCAQLPSQLGADSFGHAEGDSVSIVHSSNGVDSYTFQRFDSCGGTPCETTAFYEMGGLVTQFNGFARLVIHYGSGVRVEGFNSFNVHVGEYA